MLPGAHLGASFLLAVAALQALDGARARFGAPPLMLPGVTHVDTHIITIEIGSPQAVSATAASTCF